MEQSNESLIMAVMEMLGSKIGKTNRGYVHATCPLAPWKHSSGRDRNPSFGVVYSSGSAHKEEGHAHCFSCGYSGDIREVASLLHVWGAIDRATLGAVMGLMEQVKTGVLPLSLSTETLDDPMPPTQWLAGFPPVAREHVDAVAYLTQRGMQAEAVKHFDARFDAKRWRVSFPLYDRAHRFRGMIGRTLIKEPMGPRYFYYPYLGNAPRGFTWANEHALDLTKPVVVVEGIFDAMKVWPVYQNVVASLSVSFRTPGLGWHRDVKRWVTMFDVGQGGDIAKSRLQGIAAKGSLVWHLRPPEGRDDPADALPEEIMERLNSLHGQTPVKV